VDLRRCQLAGERVVIVGGGLTSGHLALGALARGAAVRLIVRRPLQEKLFDADAGWLGPKYLKGFAAEPDARKRWAMIQQARDGGSVTPAVRLVLRRLQRQGQLTLMESCQIREAHWQGGHWNLRCDSGDQLQADRLWLATGTQLDASTHPLLQDVLAAYPGELVQGLPVLDVHLRWRGCELYCMGGLASLQVGPVARNLSGARMASNRIAAALTKSSLAL
jgi:glycine/D-amino acid oxidase-like deaminating enzyme